MPQKTEIDPVLFSSELKNTFRRYLYTANMTSDSEPDLQDQFWTELNQPERIVHGPLIHCIPSYKQGQTLKEIIDAATDPKISSKFLSLPADQFDPTRPLYSHQIQALRLAEQGHNLIVATGTGSGKTECFLLPIIQSVFADPAPGLRAILIYPMNALANDQLDRLRRLLASCPEVTFGRYTSDTPHEVTAEEKVAAGAIANERYSRDEIRAKPPHILLTNFAMMEYLLLRPRDADLFKSNRLKFIVLDEAHSYDGSKGIEIGYLMRRLRQYLAKPPSSVQFILTSATIGSPDDRPEILTFATDLTGAPFQPEDLLSGDVVHSFSDTLELIPTVEQLRAVVKTEQDFDAWTAALENPEQLCSLFKQAGFADSPPTGRSGSRMLYDLFSRSKLLASLHQLCQKQPLDLPTVCNELGFDADDAGLRGLSWLVALGSSARRSPSAAPLLPVRLHYFCRGLVGATICINPDCQGKKSPPTAQWSQLFLENRKLCQSCEKSVLPLSTCIHCGLPVMKVHIHESDKKWHGAADPTGQSHAILLTWSDDLAPDDEEDLPTATVCLSCRAYTETKPENQCCQTPVLKTLYRIATDDLDGNLTKCPRCDGGAGDYPTVLREFTSGEEAPTAVLNEVIVRQIPFDPAKNKLPANGRNLLVFSDSRQRAAFFAPYLKQTMAETAYLGPIHQSLLKAEAREERPMALDEIADQYLRELQPASTPVAVVRARDDSGLEHFELRKTSHLTAKDKSAIKREVKISLLRHICYSTKQRSTMPGLGIAAPTFDLPEDLIDALLKLPLLAARGKDFVRQLTECVLTSMVQRAAVVPPDDITAGAVLRYPKAPEAYTFQLGNSGRIGDRLVIRWDPYSSAARSRKNSVNRCRHVAILAKTLALDRFTDEEQLRALLLQIWDAFKEHDVLIETDTWPGEYRVNYDRILLTTRAHWLCCGTCGRLSTYNLLGICQSADCSGKPVEMEQAAKEKRFLRNHYRNRYFLGPLPLEVKEHTAQLTNTIGREYQEAFIRGEVNVLSSSTTFEMGVDVGGLKAVLLRNVPPKSSNYVQRAGRAGRRKDGISVAVTFARNVPHDQHHYQTPNGIIQGLMPVPYINVANRVLAQRHINSLLLGYYLRSIPKAEFEEGVLDRLTVDQFFLQPPSGPTLCDRFAAWTASGQEEPKLSKILHDVLADDIKAEALTMLQEAVRSLADEASKSVKVFEVKLPLNKYKEQLENLAQQLTAATGGQRRAIANAMSSLERLIEQFKAQRLIDFLSSASWLPGYAFPQDIVKLLVRHVELTDRMRLERDREVGIAEYAPGSEIVADGHLLRSGAIWFNSREPEIRWYTRCPNCRLISTCLESQSLDTTCTRCGTVITGRNVPRRYLKPDAFSTNASDPPEEPGMYRRRPPRNSEVFLLEGANPEDFKEHSIPGVTYGVKLGGKMFRANSGYDFAGFQVCRRCGRAFDSRPTTPAHEAPWGGKCMGKSMNLHLAHEIVTDVLQLRFNHCNPPAPQLQNRPFWLSFEASFLHGCTDALGIDPNDLGGTYNGWTDGSWVGELVIYDRVPGGAGHIDRIVANLDKVLASALARVRDCKCGDVASSCYACLRTYSNQFEWDQLQRQPVIQWLSAILGRP
jgi:superfamily II DNA/RNA helicase